MSEYDYFDSDTKAEMCGVPGRMKRRVARSGSQLWLHQDWASERRPTVDGDTMVVRVRFDDQCGNGDNSFSIVCSIYTQNDEIIGGGAAHDDIAATFPELAHLIKWHLCSNDGPMHYVANTLYMAGDRDANGRRAGEPSAYKPVIYFGNSPVPHDLHERLRALVLDRPGPIPSAELEIVEVEHGEPAGYNFAPHYTFAGVSRKQWHECPFDTRWRAEHWREGLLSGQYRLEECATLFSTGKPRDLDGARSTAVWPDATDEQLCSPPDELRRVLEDRLPALITAMRSDIEAAGLFWTPKHCATTTARAEP